MTPKKSGKAGSLREDRARDARKRKARKKGFVIGGSVALAVVLVVGILFVANRDKGKSETPAAIGDTPLTATKTYEVGPTSHVNTSVQYPQSPPVGGSHRPVWMNCGYYGHEVSNERAVHSLEHGALWITYRPDLPASQKAALRKVAKQPYILVSAYEGPSAPVVASAWGFQIDLESATDKGLGRFIQAYKQGPKTPERGASCSGGEGRPG